MFKNEKFWNGIIWTAITGIVTYGGLTAEAKYDIFLYGMWAGVALANAVIRFYKAFKGNKNESNEKKESE